ncbi:MAG: helix-turn-helix domain-containing protein [Bacteroidetes bacterium]|nr:helix-turn-helix domain-containing protein [Bacteroidota bacterium]MBS1755980.1 helix-turn-helix domain-containing protein [Bacteroidota bacterium]
MNRTPNFPFNLLEDSNLFNQKWLDAYAVQKLLQISRGTLHNWCSKGILPYSKLGGRRYFDLEEIHKALNNSKIHSKK